jgi:hypothetical protein
MKSILGIVLIIVLSGCASVDSVVTTEISFNKQDGTFHIASPKDIAITGLTYERTESGVKVEIQEYTSKGNADAIKTIDSQNKAIESTAKALSDLAKTMR